MRRGLADTVRFFKKNYSLDYPTKETTKASRTYVKAMKALEVLLPESRPCPR